MTLSIELSPEKERVLQEEASRRGVSVENYAQALVEESLPTRNGIAEQTVKQRERLLDRIAARGGHVPAYPGETYDRETIYADHD